MLRTSRVSIRFLHTHKDLFPALSDNVEEMYVQKLRDVRQAGADALDGPFGAGERELRAGSRRYRVHRRGRARRGHGERRTRRRIGRNVRPVVRRQVGPVFEHVDGEREAVGRHDGAFGANAERGRGRRVRSIGYTDVFSLV